MSTPILKLEGVSKVYPLEGNDVKALQSIDLEIQQGEFVCIMGASGSGKSTLMNILGCLDIPTSGRYSINGVEAQNLNPDALAILRNQTLGFVFQSFNLLSRTTAVENVELPLLYAGKISSTEIRERAVAALTAVGLAARLWHFPSQLSGGQQQRVAIARAMVNKPALILADEPTGNLDSVSSVEIISVFQKLHAQGITVIMVTHESDIAAFGQRTITFRDGKILSDMRNAHPVDAEAQLQEMQNEASTLKKN